jgi:fructose-1,6-bisphosphatase I
VLSEQQKLGAAASGDLTLLLIAIQLTSKFISTNVRKASLINLCVPLARSGVYLRRHPPGRTDARASRSRPKPPATDPSSLSRRVGLAGEVNVQGEDQKKLDILSDEIMVKALIASGKCSVLITEEREDAVVVPEGPLKGQYCVVFDPLDGSSNIDAGVNVGTIFGIYKVKEGSKGTIEDVLRPGSDMVAAGYTMCVASVFLVSGPSHCSPPRPPQVRLVDQPRPDDRQRRQRLHARLGPRRVHPDAP